MGGGYGSRFTRGGAWKLSLGFWIAAATALLRNEGAKRGNPGFCFDVPAAAGLELDCHVGCAASQ